MANAGRAVVILSQVAEDGWMATPGFRVLMTLKSVPQVTLPLPQVTPTLS